MEALRTRMTREVIYLYNTYENVFLRTHPGGPFHAKRPGQTEYVIDQATDLVTETILEGNEVTREQYNAGRPLASK